MVRLLPLLPLPPPLLKQLMSKVLSLDSSFQEAGRVGPHRLLLEMSRSSRLGSWLSSSGGEYCVAFQSGSRVCRCGRQHAAPQVPNPVLLFCMRLNALQLCKMRQWKACPVQDKARHTAASQNSRC
jgi:hypothetical protein